MPRIPLPIGVVGSELLPRTQQSLSNCINVGNGVVISRPGIDTIANTQGVARGQFVWNNSLYHIISEQLYRIDDVTTGARTLIGPVGGNTEVITSIGFVEAVLVVVGGPIYTLDKNDNLSADIVGTSAGGFTIVSCRSVCFIDGRFVYIPFNGDPAFFSDVGDAASVQATSFFDAEELPDQNAVTFNLRNTLYIGGTDSFELFRNTGATPVPFTRINGARLDYGFIGALQQYADTFFFIGREKDQDFGIYAIGQGVAQKVSNERIDAILAAYPSNVLQSATSARFKWRGYDLLTFRLSRDSFGYYAGEWHKLSVLVEGDETPWNGEFVNQFQGNYYTISGPAFGRLAQINTEYGIEIPRVINLSFEQEDNEFFACQYVSLTVSQGFNQEVGTVGLAMSRNNVEFGEYLFRDLGALGEYSRNLVWNEPGGLGTYDGFMAMKFYTTQDVEFNANALSAVFRG